jgi:glycosyltransferase involved in cell wall biosynthesis
MAHQDIFLVSIIIPVFNSEKFLYDTIESVLKQSYKNLELIIVNDGSTDNSEEIIFSFKDDRIKYFKRENKGQCIASNYGLSKATGEYIKFFDADDIMNSAHIESQVKKLEGTTNAIASCAWGRFYNDDPTSAVFKPELVWKDMKTTDWLKTALSQKSDMMPAWLWLIPKKIINKSGGWDERLSLNNDFEFSTRLLLPVSDVLFCENAKVFYRSGVASSLASSKSKKAYEAAFLSTFLGCTHLLKMDDSKEMKRLCANRYKVWVHRIYPHYPDVVQKFEDQIRILGGSNLAMDSGPFLKFTSFIIGWKRAKKLKIFLSKLK